jgi:hypothetical protein
MDFARLLVKQVHLVHTPSEEKLDKNAINLFNKNVNEMDFGHVFKIGRQQIPKTKQLLSYYYVKMFCFVL